MDRPFRSLAHSVLTLSALGTAQAQRQAQSWQAVSGGADLIGRTGTLAKDRAATGNGGVMPGRRWRRQPG